MIIYEFLNKWRKKYLFLIYIIVLAFVLFYSCVYLQRWDQECLQGFQLAQRAALLPFLGFLFLSYEFFADYQKKNWRELLETNWKGLSKGMPGMSRNGLPKGMAEMKQNGLPKGMSRTNQRWLPKGMQRTDRSGLVKSMLAKDGILLILLAVVDLVVFCMELYWFHWFDAPVALLKNGYRVLFFNYFLLPFMGIQVGKAAAVLFQRKWTGYLAILVFALLGCGLVHTISSGLYMTVGWNLDAVLKLFQFQQPNAGWAVDEYYLVPAENYRMFILLFWSVLAEGIVLCRIWGGTGSGLDRTESALKQSVLRQKNGSTSHGNRNDVLKWKNRKFSNVSCTPKKLVTIIICTVCCLFLIFEAETETGYLNFDMNYGNASNKQEEFLNDTITTDVPAAFQVEIYTMNLQIRDELSADVTMQLAENTLKQYVFTLYRGYEITEVTDGNGNELLYHRTEDVVTVDAGESLREIRFCYHGFQQSFYSNKTAIMLSGYFAYYPQAGVRRVFLYQNENGYLSYGFNTDTSTLQYAHFHISCAYHKSVYSNLESGVSEAGSNLEQSALRTEFNQSTKVSGSDSKQSTDISSNASAREKHHQTFSGYTNAPTLAAGAVTDRQESDGYYILPELVKYRTFSLNQTKKQLGKLCQRLSMDDRWYADVDTVVAVPNSVYIGNTWGEMTIADRCLFVGSNWIQNGSAEDVAFRILQMYFNENGEKQYLENILFSVLQGDTDWSDLKPMSRNEFFGISYDEADIFSDSYQQLYQKQTIERMYQTLLQTFGEKEVLKQTAAYLLDKQTDSNLARFLQEMYENLEQGAI